MKGFNKFNLKNINPLMYSIRKNLLEVALELINLKLDVNVASPVQRLCFLHFLCLVKNKEILTRVFNSKVITNVDNIDAKGNTPIHYAAFKRNEFLIAKLIEAKANLNL